jgi:uncharacterized protein YigA (DUF484 family)
MSERKTQPKQTQVDAAEVAEWLAAHPDFFVEHASLLARLRIPHGTGGNSVSLIEKQVEVLRHQNKQLDRKLAELIEVARANDAAVERIHQLALMLMQADDVSDLLTGLQDTLRNRFAAEEVAIVLLKGPTELLYATPARRIERDDPGLAHFATFIKTGKPHCGRLRPPQLEFLFGERAGDVGSAAVIPLGPHAELGILAVGSKSEDQFSPTLGTVYLAHIGELVATALAPQLG